MQTRDELASCTAHVLPGLYFGTVEDVEDPEKLGRVRVRIHQLHSTDLNLTPTTSLPWAPLLGFGGFTGHGVYWTPVVGSQVIVGFLMGSPDRPICLGTAYGRGEAPAEVVGRAAEYPSNNPFGTDAFPGSNADQSLAGAPKTHVLRTPGGRQVVMDDVAETLVLESAMGNVICMSDKDNETRIELQSGAAHNLTMWDKSGEERIVMTSASGHSSTWDDRTADPNILHQTVGGHIIKMSDKTSNPEIRLQTTAGSYVSLSDIGFGGLPEVRVQTKMGAHLDMQDSGDKVYCQSAGSSGMLAQGAGYCLIGTGTGYRIDVGGSGPTAGINLTTPSGSGQISLTSSAQTNITSLTNTIAITSPISITLTAPVIKLN